MLQEYILSHGGNLNYLLIGEEEVKEAFDFFDIKPFIPVEEIIKTANAVDKPLIILGPDEPTFRVLDTDLFSVRLFEMSHLKTSETLTLRIFKYLS